jgi:hypothetical protein
MNSLLPAIIGGVATALVSGVAWNVAGDERRRREAEKKKEPDKEALARIAGLEAQLHAAQRELQSVISRQSSADAAREPVPWKTASGSSSFSATRSVASPSLPAAWRPSSRV